MGIFYTFVETNPMCYYNGIKVSKGQLLRLLAIEKELKNFAKTRCTSWGHRVYVVGATCSYMGATCVCRGGNVQLHGGNVCMTCSFLLFLSMI
jgi:hypothetical protein